MITTTALSGKTAAIILGVAGAAGGLNASVMALAPSADGATEAAAASSDAQRIQVVVDVPTSAPAPTSAVEGAADPGGATDPGVDPTDEGQASAASMAWSQAGDVSFETPSVAAETTATTGAPATTSAPTSNAPATTTAPKPTAPKPTAAPKPATAPATVPAPVTTASGAPAGSYDDDDEYEYDEHEYESHESSSEREGHDD